MITGREADLRLAVSEMSMRIRMAVKEWQNAPDHVLEQGVRIEVEVGEVDPLEWLRAQPFSQQVYWAPRDGGDRWAGVGICHECTLGSVEHPEELFRRTREVLDAFGTRKPEYLGGFSFTSRSIEESPWPEIGKSRFWIPFAELRETERGSLLACNLFFQRNVERSLQDWLHDWRSVTAGTVPAQPLPTLMFRRDHPEQPGWEANVRAALGLIENGVLDKVVLARKAEYTFASRVTSAEILGVLETLTSTCYHFLVQPSDQVSFMGTTPERLYLRKGRELSTEALAGTRPLTGDAEEDERLGRELMSEDKERREQELVRRELIRQLHLLSDSLDAQETPELLKLERKQHLLSRLSATLRPEVTDAEILKALHPTPAVGGSPRANALRELVRLEPFSRGWYAAPVGVIGTEHTEFSVAIRSGLVMDRKVNVYSGAGIVAGSDPAAEWQEIENKIVDFVTVTSGRVR